MLSDFINPFDKLRIDAEQGRSIKEKAREISYALIRVSFYVKRQDLRSRLESLAVELLEDSARASVNTDSEYINRALTDISALDSLVRLSHSIYEIEPVNATILVRELDSLNSAIRQFGNPSSPAGESGQELPNLETFFQSKLKHANSAPPPAAPEMRTRPYEYINIEEEPKVSSNGNSNGINTAIRQSAIINKIKSTPPAGGCRLKDLIAEFPDVSERTLRYDLQRFCEQGIIERVGNGGPASYYRCKV